LIDNLRGDPSIIIYDPHVKATAKTWEEMVRVYGAMLYDLEEIGRRANISLSTINEYRKRLPK
jgi:hypothetical protein